MVEVQHALECVLVDPQLYCLEVDSEEVLGGLFYVLLVDDSQDIHDQEVVVPPPVFLVLFCQDQLSHLLLYLLLSPDRDPAHEILDPPVAVDRQILHLYLPPQQSLLHLEPRPVDENLLISGVNRA